MAKHLIGPILAALLVTPTGEAAQPSWQRLGPWGARSVSQIAPSPAYATDGTILAVRETSLLRTTNRGQDWDEQPLPDGSRPAGVALPPADGPDGTAIAWTESALWRSADRGASWQRVLDWELTRDPVTVSFSPAFASDRSLLLLAGRRPYLSTDAGLTWTPLVPAEGQAVYQLFFSPAYAVDRRLYAVALSGGFPSLMIDATQGTADDHAASRGLVVSTDGGATWTDASVGLAIDGVPYRHVNAVALSPTFAADGTAFAFAWGPREPGPFMGGQARTFSGALFRSTDGTRTWALLRRWPEDAAFLRANVRLALSLDYARDQLVLLARSEASASPASSGCALDRSADGGQSWETVVQRGSYEGCADLRFADTRTALLRKQGWLLSTDAGLTWSGLVLGADASAVSVASAPSPAGPPVLFAGTSQGAIYAAGPGVGAVAGNLRCAVEPTLGFGRVWSADAGVRDSFGCPRESERPTQLLEAVSDGGRRWWFADGLGPTLVLEPGGRASVDVPVAVITPQPQRTLPAVVQRYAGGTMVWREEPGQRLITLVDETQRRWTEVPD